MNDYKLQDAIVNLEMFKKYRFYQLFDPNGVKIFGWNGHCLVFILFTTIVQLIVTYATFGFFIQMYDTLTDVELVLTITVHLGYSVWELFNVTRLDFLTSKPCREKIEILNKSRDKSIRITNTYVILPCVVAMQWMLFPVIFNTLVAPESTDRRLLNMFNFRFPVKLYFYNHYYVIFYIMETIVALFCWYVSMIVDVFLMSFCWALADQFDVISQAFAGIGHENELKKDEDYTRFKSILFDQQKLLLKLKLFYSVVEPIILIFIALNSSFIVIETYSFVLIYTSGETTSFLGMSKMGATVFYISLQLFVYCYSFDNLNSKKESVNFGIYSSNWTNMDLKFKKLLLLSMRMNDANKLMIKASPKKIVNLQLFFSVMTTLYNIVSVLIRTTHTKET